MAEVPTKHAEVIAFANQKGGVAKTTTTLNLAVAFAESGHRVLCIDLDPQGNLTMSQGIDPDKVEKSLYDVLVNDMPISEIIQHREIDIAVASIDLAGAEIAMSTKIGRERSLEKALKEVSGDYDFVCIDTPPSLGLLTINALTAASKVIVPVQCEYLSMRGLVQLQNTLKMIQENLNPDVKIEGILPTMLDSRTVHAKEAVEILEENFGDLVFKSRIKKAIKFAEAPVKGRQRAQVRSAEQRRELLPRAGRRRSWRMSRRKRASMREGPLADLFRSTSDDAPAIRRGSGPERGSSREEPAPARASGGGARRRTRRGQHAAPVTEEQRRVAAREAEAGLFRGAARRETSRLETPRYGREEPEYEPPGSGEPHQPVIRVVGVGGAGVNAVNRMVEANVPGVEFMAVNTDLQSLQLCVADVTVHIGDEQTRGLGAGADPEVGHRSAFEEQDKIKRLLKGSDMVFVAAGAGGGTGSGAAPVVARLAREVGALTVGIVTKPFSFEGSRRANQAEQGDRGAGRPRSTR